MSICGFYLILMSKFLVKIPLTNEHLCYDYFVRLSVSIKIRYLWTYSLLSFLVFHSKAPLKLRVDLVTQKFFCSHNLFYTPLKSLSSPLIFCTYQSYSITFYVRPLFRLSVCQVQGATAIFSAPNQDRGLVFSVQIPLTFDHLFCKYFFRRSRYQRHAY